MLTLTDLFAGAGGSSTGAIQIPGVEVRLAANHWQKAVEVHNANHPGADHLCADISAYDPRRIRSTDLLWASPECFTAGHLVMTARGQVSIERVIVGDLVLTHTGRWRPVLRTQHRVADTVIVKGHGHTGIHTTAGHNFWLRDSTQVWRNEIRQYRRTYSTPGWSPIGDAADREAMWATPVQLDELPVPERPEAFGFDTEHAWWLIGRWVAAGSLTFGRNHEVLIACEVDQADELADLLGTTGTVWARSDKRTAAVFSVGDPKARDWLQEHFGHLVHGAVHKQIPPWTLSLPRRERAALLAGYVSGAGCVTERRTSISTVSRALAISGRLLAESLGHRVSLGADKHTTDSVESRSGVAEPQWIINWANRPSTSRSLDAFAEGIHSWSRVRSVSATGQSEMVYNLEVAEDHSYVLDGIVVKNCTWHSQAKGAKRPKQDTDLFGETLPNEAADRSRATMWDVVRFTEIHRYQAVIVENVIEVTAWPPFAAWLLAMDSLGYDHRVVSLNSMHAQTGGLPAPQSRDRVYIVFWRKGNRRPDLEAIQRPAAFCGRCDRVVPSRQAWKNGRTVGRYRRQYIYVCPDCGSGVEPGWLPAAAAIDWTIPGTRIGDRSKPLADKTRARIAAGIARYWRPFTLEAAGNTYERHPGVRTWPADDVLTTLHTTASKALAVPVEGRTGVNARPTDQALRTLTTRLDTSLVAAPFIAELRGGGSCARSVADALATVTAAGNHHALVTPYYGNTAAAYPASETLGTLTTLERFALVMRNVNNRGASDLCSPADEVIRTLTASIPHSLIMRNNTGGPEMTTPTVEVLRTLTTGGHQSLITPGDIAAARAMVDDCLFRMFEPHEVAAGMAFPTDYLWSGTRRERVRMAGNAVTPPSARDLIGAVAASLDGEAA